MGLITKEVLAKPNRRYLSLGYEVFTKTSKAHSFKCGDVLGKGKIFDFDKYIKVKYEDLPNHSTIPLNVECDNCHEVFTTDKDHLIRKKEFKENGIWYCSKCANQIYLSGERNYNWKADRTCEQRRKERATSEYSQLKRKALYRDKYKCQVCGSHADIVHHLNSVDTFPDEIYEVNNVISLCNKCHSDFHTKYGYGNNTRKQFEEWSNKVLSYSEIDDYPFKSGKEVYCFETDKVYSSCRRCEIELNFRKGSVYCCCALLRNQYRHNGYHFIYYDEIRNMSKSEIAEYYANKIDEHRASQKCFIDLQTGIIYESRQLCYRVNHATSTENTKKFNKESYKTERFIPFGLYADLKAKNKLFIKNTVFYTTGGINYVGTSCG